MKFLEYLRTSRKQVLDEIVKGKELTEKVESGLKAAIEEHKTIGGYTSQ